jgi:hypothetical protein
MFELVCGLFIDVLILMRIVLSDVLFDFLLNGYEC